MDYLAHYGVGADNGAPGRGSGRYPKGSGKRPRSMRIVKGLEKVSSKFRPMAEKQVEKLYDKANSEKNTVVKRLQKRTNSMLDSMDQSVRMRDFKKAAKEFEESGYFDDMDPKSAKEIKDALHKSRTAEEFDNKIIDKYGDHPGDVLFNRLEDISIEREQAARSLIKDYSNLMYDLIEKHPSYAEKFADPFVQKQTRRSIDMLLRM